MLSWSKMDPNFSTKGQWLYASPLQIGNKGGMPAPWFLRTVAACQSLINFVFQPRDSGCMPALKYSAFQPKDSGCMPVLMYAEVEPKDSGCMPVLMYAEFEPKDRGCMPVLILIYFPVAVCQGKLIRV